MYFWEDDFDHSIIRRSRSHARLFQQLKDNWVDRLNRSGLPRDEWINRMDNWVDFFDEEFDSTQPGLWRLLTDLFNFVLPDGRNSSINSSMLRCFGAYLAGIGFNNTDLASEDELADYLESIPKHMLSNYNIHKITCPIEDWQDLRPIRTQDQRDIPYRKWSFSEYNKAYKYFFRCNTRARDILTFAGQTNNDILLIPSFDIFMVFEAFVTGLERNARGLVDTSVYVPPDPLPELLYGIENVESPLSLSPAPTPQNNSSIDESASERSVEINRVAPSDWLNTMSRSSEQSLEGDDESESSESLDVPRQLNFDDLEYDESDIDDDSVSNSDSGVARQLNFGGSKNQKKKKSKSKNNDKKKKKSKKNSRNVSSNGKKRSSKVITKWHKHLRKVSNKNKGVKTKGNFMQKASKTYKK